MDEKITVEVCVGTSCHLMGSSVLISTLEELSADIAWKIKTKLSLCFEVCHGDKNPPVVRINGDFYDEMTPDRLRELLLKMAGETS